MGYCRILAGPAARSAVLTTTLLAGLLASGCASNAIEVSVQTRAESYRRLEHPRTVMFSQPPACAVLPANAGGTPGLAIFMNAAIEQVLRDAGAESSVIGPTETGNLLSASGLRSELDALVRSWQPTGVLDPATLARIGETLGVRFVMMPYLATYNTNNDSRFTFLGFTFVRTGWTTVQVALQLWHTPTGTLVWQGHGISTLGCEGIIGPPVPAAPTIEQAVRPMIDDFIAGRSESIVVKELAIPTPTRSRPTTADATSNPAASPPAESTDPGAASESPEPVSGSSPETGSETSQSMSQSTTEATNRSTNEQPTVSPETADGTSSAPRREAGLPR